MQAAKKTLKIIKKYLRMFDFFGESFTFRYKDEDKHSSALSGIICISFYIFAIAYIGVNFIPFYKRKNFTLQYYSVNSNDTKDISLADWPIAFGFGLTNDNKTAEYDINDLFKITVSFRNYTDTKNISVIPHYPCKKEDFHNLDIINESIYENLSCIKPNETPQGIFTESKFSYYTISVESRYPDDKEHNKLINKYLIENDCKLQFYYTDIAINITNKTHPFVPFYNSIFLQLNPTLIQKKNIFYMNYHLTDYDKFIYFDPEEDEDNDNDDEEKKKEKKDDKKKIQTGLSRVEDYAVYKGLERAANKPEDYSLYAKIYIRADNRKIDIKRRYQDFFEFYADKSGLLLSIFWILGVIFAYYDRIITNHSISKRLFYFEGVAENKFDQFKLIKDLIEEKEKLEKNKQMDHVSTYIDKATETNSRSESSKNNFTRRNTTTKLKDYTDPINKKKKDLIDYSSYNIWEMLISFKICCCRTKKFKKKINLIKQANEMINNKLDIVFYIRSMILFELVNKVYLENKSILNFLSRPIIYINGDKDKEASRNDINDTKTEVSLEIEEIDEGKIEEKKIDEKKDINVMEYFEGDLYKTAYKLDYNALNEKITNLILHPGKTNFQKKLISMLKKHLKGV